MARTEARTWRLALATARRVARLRQPYWSAGLRSLCPVECPGLGTVGVTARGVLMVDPDALLRWPADTLPGVLIHEYLHLWFRDAAKRGSRSPRLWNVACDLRINAALLRSGWQLPEGGCTPAGMGLPDGLTAEQYYDLLVAQERPQPPQPPKPGGDEGGDGLGGDGAPADSDSDDGDDAASDPQGRDPGQGGTSPSQDGDRAPEDGSGDDSPLPWEAEEAEEGDQDGQDGQPGGDAGGEPGGQGRQPRPGGGWHGKGDGSGAGGEPLPGEEEAEVKAGGGQSESRLEGLRRAVAKAIQDHESGRGCGDSAGGWGVYADEVLAPPKIRWQDKLRHLVRGCAAHQAGSVDYTYRRPSRRQAGCGYGAGHAVVAGLHAPVPRVALVIDTSGSMGTDKLRQSVAETSGVLRLLQCEVQLFAADTEVHGGERLRTVADLRKVTLQGGGGTDFGGPLAYVIANAKPRPDIIIYLTDGFGDYGPERHDVVVIWATLGAGSPPPWGHHVEVEP